MNIIRICSHFSISQEILLTGLALTKERMEVALPRKQPAVSFRYSLQNSREPSATESSLNTAMGSCDGYLKMQQLGTYYFDVIPDLKLRDSNAHCKAIEHYVRHK